jgi:transcriptional regulator with XRE-family HTH domain
MPRTRNRNAVDEHVGARVRSRRKSLGMSQSTLADELGVTFQMIQRYEYGLCRLSASTLYATAVALEVPIDFFFVGLPLTTSGKRAEIPAHEQPALDLARTRYGRELAALFPRITHRGTRRAVVELLRAMVGEGVGV